MSSQKKASPQTKARIERAAHLSVIGNMRDADIAAELDIGLSTLASWKTRPEWAEAMKELSMRAWSEAHDRLKACTKKAVCALEEMLDDDDDRVRLRAAAMLLQHGLPFAI